jgi:hypothetical protein
MYVYGLLDAPQERAMQEHVQGCSACAEMSERIGAEHRLFEDSLAREIPDSCTRFKATDEVLARRYAPKKSVELRRLLAGLRPALGIAFVIGLFLLLFVSAGLPGPAREPLIAAPPSPAMMATAEPAPPLEIRRPVESRPVASAAAACDLKVVMSWDARATVDLDVLEPGGGHASMDHRNRYGLEIYVVPRMKSGTYRVGAQLRGSVPAKVRFLVILFEGTDAEERHEQTFVLEKPGESKYLRDIVISR